MLFQGLKKLQNKNEIENGLEKFLCLRKGVKQARATGQRAFDLLSATGR